MDLYEYIYECYFTREMLEKRVMIYCTICTLQFTVNNVTIPIYDLYTIVCTHM